MTLDEFVNLPESEQMELIDGQPVEKEPMGYAERIVQNKVGTFLETAQMEKPLGHVAVEGLIRINPDDPERGRRPDVSFITFERLGDRSVDTAYIDVCPEIIVEVISPNDLSFDVHQKIAEYLAAGAKLVWEVQREQRQVLVHRPTGPIDRLNADDTLSGEDVLPTFSVEVAKLLS
ncbi:MAG: Uma2 family endonuclease [Planctomycetota bacterium]